MTTSVVDSMTGPRVTHETGAVIQSVSRGRVQGADADQVVRRRGEQELPVHAPSATVPELAQSADGLHPAEDFLDAFAGALTDGIARMPGGPRIERATVLLLCDMRRRLQVAQGLYEAAGVVALVATNGDTPAGQTRDETRRRVALTGARRRDDARVDDQPMPVLHQHFAEIGQLGFMAFRFLEQPAVGVRRRLMRLIRPPFSMKIDRRISRIVRRGTGLILPLKTLQTGPGFQQGAIDGEMLRGQELAAPRLLDHIFREGPGNVTLKQAIAILGERGRHPHGSSMPSPTNQRNSRL